jgi:peroxin-5
MSFLGGAECSTAGNPLTQFTKHVQDDKSLQRDRLVGRGPGMQESMRSRGMMGGQDQVRSWNAAAHPVSFPRREGSQRRPVYHRMSLGD